MIFFSVPNINPKIFSYGKINIYYNVRQENWYKRPD